MSEGIIDPSETLVAYSQKKASTDDVMRALLCYNNWSAPVPYAADVLQTNEFEKVSIWGNGNTMPADELWLFTEEWRGLFAWEKGVALGLYANQLRGVPLFRQLPRNLRAVKVNPGGELSEFWFIASDAFGLVEMWAKAIELEHELALGPSPDLYRKLRAFPGFTVLVYPNNSIVTAVGAGGMQNPAMVFTTPDCAAKVHAQVPQARQEHVDGERFFSLLPRQGVDGCIFNPLGPGPVAVLPIEACALILRA
ncbi:MAG: hypothetical protein KBF88_01510 [Polyangiaceae bacterium]|nr:hypothetical protein [Polyangiaceae bacterium]